MQRSVSPSLISLSCSNFPRNAFSVFISFFCLFSFSKANYLSSKVPTYKGINFLETQPSRSLSSEDTIFLKERGCFLAFLSEWLSLSCLCYITRYKVASLEMFFFCSLVLFLVCFRLWKKLFITCPIVSYWNLMLATFFCLEKSTCNSLPGSFGRFA